MSRASAGATVTSEMNDRSATATSAGPPGSASTWRRLVRSRTTTRGSSRRRQASWPCPTSRATTSRAPRWSRQSVKPPVEAPASSARAPATSRSHATSAASSFSPPRDTNRAGGAVHDHGLVGCDLAGDRSGGRAADGHQPGLDRGDGLRPTGQQPAAHQLGVESPTQGALRTPGRRDRSSRLLAAAFFAARFAADFLRRLLAGRLRRRLRGLLRADPSLLGRALLPGHPGLELGEIVLGRDPSVFIWRWISWRTTSITRSVRRRLSSTRSSTKPCTWFCARCPCATSSLARARAWDRVIATNSTPASRYLLRSGDCGITGSFAAERPRYQPSVTDPGTAPGAPPAPPGRPRPMPAADSGTGSSGS